MKSSGKFYAIIFVVMVLVFGFFFSTKAWMPDDRPLEITGYDQVLTVGDWMMRLQNATYNPNDKTLKVTVLEKAQVATPANYKIATYLEGQSLNKKLPSTLSQNENDPNTVTLDIQKVPSDFYFVTVVVTAKSYLDTESSENSSSTSSTYQDIFDNKSQTTQTAPTTMKIQIDYRKVTRSKPVTSSVTSSVSERKS